MQYFFDLGLKIMEWFKNIAHFFTIPMNSPDFISFLTPETGNVFLDAQFKLGSLPLYGILQLAGGVTFLEFFLSTGLSFFVAYTLLKWLLPTS